MPNDLIDPRLLTLGSQLSGLLQADGIRFKPKPRFRTPPAFIKSHILGNVENGDVRRFTQCQIWLHSPSIQYPTISIFISLKNARGSVFTRLQNIQELQSLANFILTSLDSLIPLAESLKPQIEIMEGEAQRQDILKTQLAKTFASNQALKTTVAPEDMFGDDGLELDEGD